MANDAGNGICKCSRNECGEGEGILCDTRNDKHCTSPYASSEDHGYDEGYVDIYILFRQYLIKGSGEISVCGKLKCHCRGGKYGRHLHYE